MRQYLPEEAVEELSLLKFTKEVLFPLVVRGAPVSPREKWLLGLRVDDAAVLLDDYLIEKMVGVANSSCSGVYFPFPQKQEYTVDDLCWVRRWAVEFSNDNCFFEDYFTEFHALLHGDIVPARHRHAVDRCGAAALSPPWAFLPS